MPPDSSGGREGEYLVEGEGAGRHKEPLQVLVQNSRKLSPDPDYNAKAFLILSANSQIRIS
jgi:hypothetical protein